MKSWWKSKTLWFNILALIVMVAAEFGYTGQLSSEWANSAAIIVAIINLILRKFTTTKLIK